MCRIKPREAAATRRGDARSPKHPPTGRRFVHPTVKIVAAHDCSLLLRSCWKERRFGEPMRKTTWTSLISGDNEKSRRNQERRRLPVAMAEDFAQGTALIVEDTVKATARSARRLTGRRPRFFGRSRGKRGACPRQRACHYRSRLGRVAKWRRSCSALAAWRRGSGQAVAASARHTSGRFLVVPRRTSHPTGRRCSAFGSSAAPRRRLPLISNVEAVAKPPSRFRSHAYGIIDPTVTGRERWAASRHLKPD